MHDRQVLFRINRYDISIQKSASSWYSSCWARRGWLKLLSPRQTDRRTSLMAIGLYIASNGCGLTRCHVRQGDDSTQSNDVRERQSEAENSAEHNWNDASPVDREVDEVDQGEEYTETNGNPAREPYTSQRTCVTISHIVQRGIQDLRGGRLFIECQYCSM